MSDSVYLNEYLQLTKGNKECKYKGDQNLEKYIYII